MRHDKTQHDEAFEEGIFRVAIKKKNRTLQHDFTKTKDDRIYSLVINLNPIPLEHLFKQFRVEYPR